MTCGTAVLVLAALPFLMGPVGAQPAAGATVGPLRGASALSWNGRRDVVLPALVFPPAPAARRPPEPWQPVAASALLPGAGQLGIGQWRAVIYAAIEGFGWVQHARYGADARRQRDRYRALARDVARAPFGGDRPVGDFAYYERMESYVASGAYDRVPGGALEPELDPATFNGAMWALARETYWADPDVTPDPASAAYRDAVAFYQRRATTPEYRWTWQGAAMAHTEFQASLRRSNDARRLAGVALAVLIANHVGSAVDAAISVRLLPLGDGRAAVVAHAPLPRLARGMHP
ncbi:MAG TPA: hypothetical protein VFY16_04980 [Gemmatimonadaceae bacterium]|nr:hypothetical protein [Gemmatimonadaceae bacterium]